MRLPDPLVAPRRTIPLVPDAPDAGRVLPLPPRERAGIAVNGALTDTRGRALRDLRISVTDRCNFRCGYCMPREAFGRDHAFLPQGALLSFEEITRSAQLFLSLGVRTLRLTGGEPLLRKDLERLVAQLAGLKTIEGTPPDIALTTNGSLLRRKAQALRDAGLRRVTVSLDALDPSLFARMSDSAITVHEVLDGIDAAREAGLGPVKVNMVVQRGINDTEVVSMARHFRHSGVELRFIEFMDVGKTNAWQRDVVLASDAVRARIAAEWPLQPAEAPRPGATAERWAYADGAGHVGFISSVTAPFCGDCTRLRLSTDGRLYTCLFADRGHDLRALLRGGEPDDAIRDRLTALWQQRSDRYSELRGRAPAAPERIEMSFIGG
ncbi:GTP 3',8-cyclase MoaA [Aquabacterium olei]|uniref:GTP 3',8-cyclase n=1 Tax=Aquabacterium olei TaxID=1296669 RepID=A0A2U8FTD4_9BURK|nr:GTP 3',8-cyclase MoaA [Aquabacterium olei]AWI53674.1 GTP 3',8-cyclase MoaA [Aquabacterium olei]